MRNQYWDSKRFIEVTIRMIHCTMDGNTILWSRQIVNLVTRGKVVQETQHCQQRITGWKGRLRRVRQWERWERKKYNRGRSRLYTKNGFRCDGKRDTTWQTLGGKCTTGLRTYAGNKGQQGGEGRWLQDPHLSLFYSWVRRRSFLYAPSREWD